MAENSKKTYAEYSRKKSKKFNLLSRLCPYCVNCGKIYDGEGKWRDLDSFINYLENKKPIKTKCSECK